MFLLALTNLNYYEKSSNLVTFYYLVLLSLLLVMLNSLVFKEHLLTVEIDNLMLSKNFGIVQAFC